jgi:hypothetical protein
MRTRLRTFTVYLIGTGALAALGLWIYISAGHKVAVGGFPPDDGVILILLILWWWWPNPEVLFSREAPFHVVSISEAPAERRGGVRARLIWTTVSAIGWVVFDLRGASAAQLAFLTPSTESLSRYEFRSLEFFLFVYIWIVAFPIFRTSSGEVAIRSLSKRRLITQGVIFLGSAVAFALLAAHSVENLRHAQLLSALEEFRLLQALLVRATVAIYALLVIRWVTPTSVFRFASIFRAPILPSTANK